MPMPTTTKAQQEANSEAIPPLSHQRRNSHVTNPLSAGTHQRNKAAVDDQQQAIPKPLTSPTSGKAQRPSQTSMSASTTNLTQQAMAEVRFSRAFSPLLFGEGLLADGPQPFYFFIPHLRSRSRPSLDHTSSTVADNHGDGNGANYYPYWLPSDMCAKHLTEIQVSQQKSILKEEIHPLASPSPTPPLSSLELLLRATISQLATSTAAVVSHIVSTSVLRHIDLQIASLVRMEQVAATASKALSTAQGRAHKGAEGGVSSIPPSITVMGHEEVMVTTPSPSQPAASPSATTRVNSTDPYQPAVSAEVTERERVLRLHQSSLLLSKVQSLCKTQKAALVSVRKEYVLLAPAATSPFIAEAEATRYWRTLNFVFGMVLFGPSSGAKSWAPNVFNNLTVITGESPRGATHGGAASTTQPQPQSSASFDAFFYLLESFAQLWLQTLYPDGNEQPASTLSEVEQLLMGREGECDTSLRRFRVIDTTNSVTANNAHTNTLLIPNTNTVPHAGTSGKPTIPNATWDLLLGPQAAAIIQPAGAPRINKNAKTGQAEPEHSSLQTGSRRTAYLHLLPALVPLHALSAEDQFRLMFNPLPTSVEHLIDVELQERAVEEMCNYATERAVQRRRASQPKTAPQVPNIGVATQRSSLSSKLTGTVSSHSRPMENGNQPTGAVASSASVPIGGASVASETAMNGGGNNPNFIASINSNNLFVKANKENSSSNQALRVLSISMGDSDGRRNSAVVEITNDSSVFIEPHDEGHATQQPIAHGRDVEMSAIDIQGEKPTKEWATGGAEANAPEGNTDTAVVNLIARPLAGPSSGTVPAKLTKRGWGEPISGETSTTKMAAADHLSYFLTADDTPADTLDPSLSSLLHVTDLQTSVAALERHIARAVALASHPVDPLMATKQQEDDEGAAIVAMLEEEMSQLKRVLLASMEGQDSTQRIVQLRDLQLLMQHAVGLSAAFNDEGLPLAAGLRVAPVPARSSPQRPTYPLSFCAKIGRAILVPPSPMPLPMIDGHAGKGLRFQSVELKAKSGLSFYSLTGIAGLSLAAVVATTILSILSVLSNNLFDSYSFAPSSGVGWAPSAVSIVAAVLVSAVAVLLVAGVSSVRAEASKSMRARQLRLVFEFMIKGCHPSPIPTGHRPPQALAIGPLALFAIRIGLLGGGRYVPQFPPTLAILRKIKLEKSVTPKTQRDYHALLLSTLLTLQTSDGNIHRRQRRDLNPNNSLAFLLASAAPEADDSDGPDRVTALRSPPLAVSPPASTIQHPSASRLSLAVAASKKMASSSPPSSSAFRYRQAMLLLLILHKVATGDDAKYKARRQRLIASAAEEALPLSRYKHRLDARRAKEKLFVTSPETDGGVSHDIVYSSLEADNSSDYGRVAKKAPPKGTKIPSAATQRPRPQGSGENVRAGMPPIEASVADMQQLLKEAGNFTVAGSTSTMRHPSDVSDLISHQLAQEANSTPSKKPLPTTAKKESLKPPPKSRAATRGSSSYKGDAVSSSSSDEGQQPYSTDETESADGEPASFHMLARSERRKSSLPYSLGIFPPREGTFLMLRPQASSEAALRKRSISSRSDMSSQQLHSGSQQYLPPKRTASTIVRKRVTTASTRGGGGRRKSGTSPEPQTDSRRPSKTPKQKRLKHPLNKTPANPNGEDTVCFSAGGGGTFQRTGRLVQQHPTNTRHGAYASDYDSGDKYRVSQDSSVRTGSTGGGTSATKDVSAPVQPVQQQHPLQHRVPMPNTMLSLGQVMEGFRAPSALGSASTAGNDFLRPASSSHRGRLGMTPDSAMSGSRPPSQPFAEEQYSAQQVDVKVSTLHQHLVLIGIRKFKVFTWSKAAQDLTGLTEAEVKGSHMSTLVADGAASLNTIKTLFTNADARNGEAPPFGRIALLSRRYGTIALRCSVGVAKVHDPAKNNKVSNCAIIVGTVLDETDVNAIHYIYQVQRAVEQQLRAKAMAEMVAVAGRVAATTALATYLAATTARVEPAAASANQFPSSAPQTISLANAHKARSAGVHAANAVGLWWMRKAPPTSFLPPLLRQMAAPAQTTPFAKQQLQRGASSTTKLPTQHVRSNALSDLNARLVSVGGSVSILKSFLRHSHWADLSARCSSVKHWVRLLPDDLVRPVLDFCNDNDIEMKVLIDRSVGAEDSGAIYCDGNSIVAALTALLKAIATTADGTITSQSVVMHLVQRELLSAPTSKNSTSQASARSGGSAETGGGLDSADLPSDAVTPTARDNAAGYLYERVAGEAGGLGKAAIAVQAVGDGQLIPRLTDTTDERDITISSKNSRNVVLAIHFEIPDDSSFSWAEVVQRHGSESLHDGGELKPHSALYLKVTGACFVTKDGTEAQAPRKWAATANMAMVPPTEAAASEFFVNKLCGVAEEDEDLPEGGEDVQSFEGHHAYSSRNASISSRGGGMRPPSSTSVGSNSRNPTVTNATGRPSVGGDPSVGPNPSALIPITRARTSFEVIVPISLTPLDSTVGMRGLDLEEDPLVLTIIVVQPNAPFATFYSHTLSQRRHMVFVCGYQTNNDLLPQLATLVERRSPDMIIVADSCVATPKESSSTTNHAQKPLASAIVSLAKSVEAVLVWAVDFSNPNRSVVNSAETNAAPTTNAGQLQALLNNNLWGGVGGGAGGAGPKQPNDTSRRGGAEAAVEVKEGPNTNLDGTWIVDNRLTCLLPVEEISPTSSHQAGLASHGSVHYGSIADGTKKQRIGVWKRIMAAIEMHRQTQKALQQRREYYQKVEVVGKGAYGEVWKVRDMATKGILAVKIMRVGTDSVAAGILREIETLSRLEHPHIVRYMFARMGVPDNSTAAVANAIANGGGVGGSPIRNQSDGAQLQPSANGRVNAGAIVANLTNNTASNQNVLSIFMEFCPWSVEGILKQCTQGSVSSPDGRNIPAALVARFPLPYVVYLVKQLADAVLFLHGRNIAHRDIKPGNLLLTSDDSGRIHHTYSGMNTIHGGSAFLSTMKLSDFGSAVNNASGSEEGGSPPAAAADPTGNAAQPSAAIRGMGGTPRYMAPEVFREEVYAMTCDLWSIGMTMLDMLHVMPTDINSCRVIPDFFSYYNLKAIGYQQGGATVGSGGSATTASGGGVSASGIGIGMFGGMGHLGGGLAAAVAATSGYTNITSARGTPQSISPFFPQLGYALEALVEQHINVGLREITGLQQSLCQITKTRLQGRDSKVYTKGPSTSSTSTRTPTTSVNTRISNPTSNRRTSSSFGSPRLQMPLGAATPTIDVNNTTQLLAEAKAHIAFDLCGFLEACLAFRPDHRCPSAMSLISLPLLLNPLLNEWFELFYDRNVVNGGVSSPTQQTPSQPAHPPSAGRAHSTGRHYHRTASEYGSTARAGTTIVMTSSTFGAGASQPHSRSASMSHVIIDRSQLGAYQQTDSTRYTSNPSNLHPQQPVQQQQPTGMGSAHPMAVGGYVGGNPFHSQLRSPALPLLPTNILSPSAGQLSSRSQSSNSSSSVMNNLANTGGPANHSSRQFAGIGGGGVAAFAPPRMPSPVQSNSQHLLSGDPSSQQAPLSPQPFAVPVAISLTPQHLPTIASPTGITSGVMGGFDVALSGGIWGAGGGPIAAGALDSGSWTVDDSTSSLAGEEEAEEFEEVEESDEGGLAAEWNGSQLTAADSSDEDLGSGVVPIAQAASTHPLPHSTQQTLMAPLPTARPSGPLSMPPTPQMQPPLQPHPPVPIQALFQNIFNSGGHSTYTGGIGHTTGGLPPPQSLAATAGHLGSLAGGDTTRPAGTTIAGLALTHGGGPFLQPPLLGSVAPSTAPARGVLGFDDDDDD